MVAACGRDASPRLAGAVPPHLPAAPGARLEREDDVCCLYWVISHAEQENLDEALLRDFHEEIQACARLVGAIAVEGCATSGALTRSCGEGSLRKASSAASAQVAGAIQAKPRLGEVGASAADSVVRLGQLIGRWASKQDPPLPVRLGVHRGRLRPVPLPWGERMGYFGESLGTARLLAETAPRESCVHISREAKDHLRLLEGLAFSCMPSAESYYLEPWTQVIENPDDGHLGFGEPASSMRSSSGEAGLASSPSCSPSAFQRNIRRASRSLRNLLRPEPIRLDPGMTVDEFRDFLAEYGVDVWQYGRGQATTMEEFHRRAVVEQRARLIVTAEGLLEQQLELVRIDLVVTNPVGDAPQEHHLMLTSEILPDGRARGRNQKFAYTVPMTSNWEDAVEECFERKLGLSPALQRELLTRDPQSYWYDEERLASQTTPGIMTTYFKHEVIVRVIDATRPELSHLGLPQLRPFTTPASPRLGMHESNWAWHPVGEEGSSRAALEHLLQRFGINVAEFTPDAFAELWDEVYNAKYSTLAVREDRQLERRINVIKVWLSADLLSLEHVLVKRWEFEKGKFDPRVKDRPVSTRMPRDQSWEEAVALNVMDKLGLDQAFQKGHLCIDERSYRLSEEVGYSSRYPGLRTVYSIHEVKCRIQNPAASGMEVLGLPEGTDFTVTRVRRLKSGGTDSVVTGWSWKPVADLGRRDLYSQRGLVDRPAESAGADQPSPKRKLPAPAPLRSTPRPDGHAGTQNTLLEDLMRGKSPNLERALNAATRIRDAKYTCRHFFEDCLAAFPELALYVSGQDSAPPDLCREALGGMPTTSGRTVYDEYQRTMGALFALYWLMRLSSDGAQCFCFGVDEDWYPLSATSPLPKRSAEELRKRQAFLEQMRWEELETLLIDAGLLVARSRLPTFGPAASAPAPAPSGGGGAAAGAGEGAESSRGACEVRPEATPEPKAPKGKESQQPPTHSVERTLAMLVLTAIHDVMKVQPLLPIVEQGRGPWCGYQVGEKISDHDAALGYILEFLPDALPSFSMLPRAQKQAVRFTQCKMDYNMGWLVQAEAPPGALFKKFKKVVESGEASAPDVAFYFVHWLTDLAGAEPCPQEGCEKFVLNFPQRVLASFLSSFAIVQNLSSRTETEVLEDYLVWRWRTSEGAKLGPAPSGPGSIARLRVVIMAQGNTKQILSAFLSLPQEDSLVLEEELARTGCADQQFVRERALAGDGPGLPVDNDVAEDRRRQGPAILVYYSPALLQKAGKVDPAGALTVLADLFRQARSLFPLHPARADETVVVRVDALKDLHVKAIREPGAPGEVWALQKVSSKDAQVRRVNLVQHQKEGFNWDTSRILFRNVPKLTGTYGRARRTIHRKTTSSLMAERNQTRASGGVSWPGRNSVSPSPMHREGASFWRRRVSDETVEPSSPTVVPANSGGGQDPPQQEKQLKRVNARKRQPLHFNSL